jgi:membrane protease YdiL (CAAX protease family)
LTGPRPRRDLDLLALIAILIALLVMPFLGIGHPVTHVLVIAVVIVYGRLLRDPRGIRRGLDLGWLRTTAWAWIVPAGLISGVLRWALDERLLDGRGGITFYNELLRQYGIVGPGGDSRWHLLAACAPVLLAVIVLDGVFFSGLIQRRIAARTNVHIGVLSQAVLFALPHIFAGSTPDFAYGVGTFIAGIAYGYVYNAYRNHWLPASMLWLHVITVWAIMLARP